MGIRIRPNFNSSTPPPMEWIHQEVAVKVRTHACLYIYIYKYIYYIFTIYIIYLIPRMFSGDACRLKVLFVPFFSVVQIALWLAVLAGSFSGRSDQMSDFHSDEPLEVLPSPSHRSRSRIVPNLAPPSSFPDSLSSAERDWRKPTHLRH